jgi:methionyl aminopeptidase
MIPDGSIVKIDFGAEVDGFITDTAVTLSLSPAYDAMVVAVEAALKEAIAAVTPGRRISEVGGIIERCVRSYGYKPIKDLSGHKIERYRIHADKTVPNVSGFGRDRFEVGEVYAIEPFLTLKRASGTIRALKDSYIYRFMTVKGAPTGDAEKLADYIQNTYRGLPFTPRWLVERFGEETITETFKELVRRKCVVGYPVLVEASGSVVAQAEHTILVTEAGCRTLT